ncbi:unnamed protein product [Clonostachys solani]|uniref:RNA polymerase I-specific transcription initiation factor rrn5 n=1 Tax=Clonostachys solani TaxID=160281 RepID=A0A9N9Z4C0_9HYPO|nr:unnamed protein product [Clonostachys solani]
MNMEAGESFNPDQTDISAVGTPERHGQQHVSSQESEAEQEEVSPLTLRLLRRHQYDSEVDEDWNSEDGSEQSAEGFNSLKRPAGDEEETPRPFKRQKGTLNPGYLDLLNRDIEDAAYSATLEDDDNFYPSQLGLVWWTRAEKRVFYEAIARLGRDNLEQISARIGSKSVVEVHQYIDLLEKEQESRRRSNLRSVIEISEYPAAVELSQQCCHALDEAADAISLRQEAREQQREETKWGDTWNLTPQILKSLEGVAKEQNLADTQLASLQLFDVPQWLQLSRRIFMNSSIPSNNWEYVDDNLPSIWATTIEDFYSLALSITRRLVQTTIFTSMARIRARLEMRPETRNVILRRDVEIAAESLGLTLNSKEFWRRSARRLRLEVYKDPPHGNEDEESCPMPYEEVEQELSISSTEKQVLPEPSNHRKGDDVLDAVDNTDESDSEVALGSSDEEERAVKQELNEVLRFSAADLPETLTLRQSLRTRIETERKQEQYAERCDGHESYKAEVELWDLLQVKPPMSTLKMADPGQSQKSTLELESMYPLGRDWRSRTKYCSEWEQESIAKDS